MLDQTFFLVVILAALAAALMFLHRRAVRIDREHAAHAATAQRTASNVVPVIATPAAAPYFRHLGESLRLTWEAHVRDAPPEALASGLARVAHRGAWSLTVLPEPLRSAAHAPELEAMFRALEKHLESSESAGGTMDAAEIEDARTELERLVNTVRMLARG